MIGLLGDEYVAVTDEQSRIIRNLYTTVGLVSIEAGSTGAVIVGTTTMTSYVIGPDGSLTETENA